jgi:abortive infection bacteriophage resistance protein
MSEFPSLKPFKTFHEQAMQLVQRGMSSSAGLNQDELVHEIMQDLAYINYYRLSAYWYAYRRKRQTGELTDDFKSKTHWETIRGLYMFDRRLRGMIFDAISRIEIALRTQIAHIWAKHTKQSAPQRDTNCYSHPYTVSKLDKKSNQSRPSDYATLLSKVDTYYKKINDDVARHHKKVYGIKRAADLPVWVFVEYSTFGNLASLLSGGLPPATVASIADNFGFSDADFFVSCVNLLNDVRNTCAHQGRVWNRYWLTPKGAHYLKSPNKCFPSWQMVYCPESQVWKYDSQQAPAGLTGNNYQTASVLTICQVLLRTSAPKSQWKDRLLSLIANTNNPLPDMYRYIGFTNSHWNEHPLWQ